MYGHFLEIEDSKLQPWLHIDDAAAAQSAAIVGARDGEVAIMQTLTANLHFLMASFYRPTKERFKIIIEGKAFPSDHYAVESQLQLHNLDSERAMVCIEPPNKDSPILSTSHILSIIDDHAASTALLLLPGVQFYTGQLFDMATITAHAQAKGIVVGWDLAHAVGNVPLALHDWNVDFAAWCNYKYMNCGPGAIGGLFVHERHGAVEACTSASADDAAPRYRPRLAGWWGSSKSSRFAMTNRFAPIPGARGFQLSNPSALDLSAVLASLAIFAQTDMATLRAKSLLLTGCLEHLLTTDAASPKRPYTIITPSDTRARGAQLSIRLDSGLLEAVMASLEQDGVVIDERKPDVVRVAPAPLYNTFTDVWRFVHFFQRACVSALEKQSAGTAANGNIIMDGGHDAAGWSEIK